MQKRMNLEERQRARREADKRRPIYRGAMWGCYIAASLFAYAFGRFARYELTLASIASAAFCALLTAYAFHFDNESRRQY